MAHQRSWEVAMIELKATDVKQWLYCPRVVYWTYVVPIEKHITPKMEYGADAHAVLSALERRRKLREYGLADGERRFHVTLRSERLGLVGKLDLLVVCRDGRHFPVEFKDTLRGVERNHMMQLGAYALLVEDTYGASVSEGAVYLIPRHRVQMVAITKQVKADVVEVLNAVRRMIAAEELPPPPERRGRCVDCEYQRFCGDRQ